ncbi:MAG: hypothetical protein ACOCQ3_05140 [Natronomonas sp.]
MNRRAYLVSSVVAGVGFLTGCTTQEPPEHPTKPNPEIGSDDDTVRYRHGIEFDRVVDAVADLGMDPTGTMPIDNQMAFAYHDGTLVQFPPGDYMVAAPHAISGEKRRFGIRGMGDDNGDVTFHFPYAEGAFWFVHQDGGEDILLENFSIDTDGKHVSIRCRTNGGSVIQDVEWRGFIPEKTDVLGQLLDPGCLSVDGVNTVRRVTIGRDGAHVSGHHSITGEHSITAIRFYGKDTRTGRMDHVGETVLDDVRIHQIGSDGVRHTHGSGVVTVKGGLYKNCHLSSLRIHNGNHPSKNSSVTGATVVIDHDDAKSIGTGSWSEHASAGIMLDSTGHGYAQPTYTDCDIICRSIVPDGGWGLIRGTNTGLSNPGGAVFQNCRIVNDTELQTIRIDPRKSSAERPHRIIFDDVSVTVTAKAQPEHAIFDLRDDWDGSIISDCRISAPRGNFDGIHVQNCDDVTIKNTRIDVSGYATVLTNATLNTDNLTYSR